MAQREMERAEQAIACGVQHSLKGETNLLNPERSSRASAVRRELDPTKNKGEYFSRLRGEKYSLFVGQKHNSEIGTIFPLKINNIYK
jgi:hypothetical protein